MAVLTTQIRGIHMVRHRDGEDLSDPVTEFEDGDESWEVVAHFNTAHKIIDPNETELDEAPILEDVGAATLEVGEVGVGTGGLTGDQNREEENPSHEDADPHRKLRERLEVAGKGGLRDWLKTLAQEAAARPHERLEVHMAHRLPGAAWIRSRIWVRGDQLEIRSKLKCGAPRGREGSTITVRAHRALPFLILTGSGRLQPDASILDLDADFQIGSLDRLSERAERRLEAIERMPVDNAAEALDELCEQDPTSVLRVVARALADSEIIGLSGSPEDQGLPPTFADYLAASSKDASGPKFDLLWTDDDKPQLAETSTDEERLLDADLSIASRLAQLALAARRPHPLPAAA